MTPPRSLVWASLLRLADCLCTSVKEAGLPDLCFCGVQPGAAVVYDFIHSGGCEDSDGMGWVRLGSVFFSRDGQQPAPSTVPCGTDKAFTFDIGIVRSMPLGDDGEPPSAEQFLEAAAQQVSEMEAMARAVTCCYERDASLSTYAPIGPDGGAIGGFWRGVAPADAD